MARLILSPCGYDPFKDLPAPVSKFDHFSFSRLYPRFYTEYIKRIEACTGRFVYQIIKSDALYFHLYSYYGLFMNMGQRPYLSEVELTTLSFALQQEVSYSSPWLKVIAHDG